MKPLAALLLAFLAVPSAAGAAGPAAADPAAQEEEAQTVFSREPRPKDEPTPVAQALDLAFGATFFAQVRVSTSGPVIDLSRLSHEGFYKLELIELLLMSAKAKRPLQEAVLRRRKGDSLSAIAGAYGLDYDRLYDAALAVEERVDRDYLPRFPQRRPRRDREQR